MQLSLEDPIKQTRLDTGPVDFVRFVGTSLHLGDEIKPTAVFERGQWVTSAGIFPIVRVTSPVALSFEDGEHSETHGPFVDVLIIGGVVRHGSDANALLARLDDVRGCWEVGSERRVYRTLVLESP